MRQIGTEELKKIQLEIMDVVMKFCSEHDILCFLDAGTLLGAIRHKGYIPWDDDIDLGMLRPDYDKFMKLFNEENTRYKFHCLENDPEVIFPFGKVFDTFTECYEPDRKSGVKMSINIDIWPMDNAPDEDRMLKRMFFRQLCYRKLHGSLNAHISAPGNPTKSIFRTIFLVYPFRILTHTLFAFISDKNYFARKLLANAKQFSSIETKRVGSFLGGHELAIDREKFEKFTYAEFEGRQCKIPSGYDEWLTKLYGDYMQLPPKSKQISHHIFEAFVKEEGE